MGLLVDRRDELGRTRTEVLNRIRRLLMELVPGGGKRLLSARQARALADTIVPADPAARIRLRPVLEFGSAVEPPPPRRHYFHNRTVVSKLNRHGLGTGFGVRPAPVDVAGFERSTRLRTRPG
ncbi:hypothetical protein [Nocardia sp. BMG111209]|uniref:hypothetical protein n=1 Tax=Nocardia sp. BMG111209 TaxID=1160137 RepID=UPI0012DC696D|nr:hypothetical protein [Nocardia sp. BMG111209]